MRVILVRSQLVRSLLVCSLLALSAGLCFAQNANQDTNFATGPQYLANGPALFARPISTPSMSISEPPLETGASDATEATQGAAGAQNRTVSQSQPDAAPAVDLFPIYYGQPRISVIGTVSPTETSEAQAGANVLNAILETGTWRITTAHALRGLGYGETLAEASGQVKSQGRRTTRLYTNADIQRLRGGS